MEKELAGLRGGLNAGGGVGRQVRVAEEGLRDADCERTTCELSVRSQTVCAGRGTRSKVPRHAAMPRCGATRCHTTC